MGQKQTKLLKDETKKIECLEDIVNIEKMIEKRTVCLIFVMNSFCEENGIEKIPTEVIQLISHNLCSFVLANRHKLECNLHGYSSEKQIFSYIYLEKLEVISSSDLPLQHQKEMNFEIFIMKQNYKQVIFQPVHKEEDRLNIFDRYLFFLNVENFIKKYQKEPKVKQYQYDHQGHFFLSITDTLIFLYDFVYSKMKIQPEK